MRIGWLIPGIGIFGSVREVIETCNVLVRRGHEVTIYHPFGVPCPWLPCLAGAAKLEEALEAGCDALILVAPWQGECGDVLRQARARLKFFCLMGFAAHEMGALREATADPEPIARSVLRLIADMQAHGCKIITDSSWQIRWLAERGIVAGPAIGGVNLEMFRPVKVEREGPPLVAWSGDPRPRKGGEVVEAALEIVAEQAEVEVDSYFGRGIKQDEMAAWLSRATVFVDGQRHGGWNNPVAEAMACRRAVACTDILAVRDFAVHEQTALVAPPDDPAALAAAVLRLLSDGDLRARLARRAHRRIQRFSYERIAPRLEAALEGWLRDLPPARP